MDLFFKKFAGVRKKVEEKFGGDYFFSIFAPLFTKVTFFEKIEEKLRSVRKKSISFY